MEYRSITVEHFFDFMDSEEVSDPLNPLIFSITVDMAKDIDNYYKRIIGLKDKEIRELKEVIVNQEISKLNK